MRGKPSGHPGPDSVRAIVSQWRGGGAALARPGARYAACSIPAHAQPSSRPPRPPGHRSLRRQPRWWRVPRLGRGHRDERRLRLGRVQPHRGPASNARRADPRRGSCQRHHAGLAARGHRGRRDQHEPLLVRAHVGLPGAGLRGLRRRTRRRGCGRRTVLDPAGRPRHVPVRRGHLRRHAPSRGHARAQHRGQRRRRRGLRGRDGRAVDAHTGPWQPRRGHGRG